MKRGKMKIFSDKQKRDGFNRKRVRRQVYLVKREEVLIETGEKNKTSKPKERWFESNTW